MKLKASLWNLLLLSCLTVQASTESKLLPLWEIGAGVLPFQTDNYRGSPQHKWFLFPLLAYIYRGRNVEAENGYVRGHLVKFGDFTLDLSFSLGLNVNSDSDRLRNGMRDLDPTFELGPILRYYLWKSPDSRHFINLEMPYRAVYTTNLRYVDHIGYYSIPYVNFLSRGTKATFGWASEVSLGVQYGSSSFHNHYYAIQSHEVNPRRPLYHSASGYSGTQLAVIFSKRIRNFLIAPFFRYDYLDGTVYRDSPLVKNLHYTFYGVSLIWYFGQSEKPQEAPTMVR